MNHAKISSSTEIFAGAIICVVQHVAPLQHVFAISLYSSALLVATGFKARSMVSRCTSLLHKIALAYLDLTTENEVAAG
jgi:energy-converting hydrogenase Eha subunit C